MQTNKQPTSLLLLLNLPPQGSRITLNNHEVVVGSGFRGVCSLPSFIEVEDEDEDEEQGVEILDSDDSDDEIDPMLTTDEETNTNTNLKQIITKHLHKTTQLLNNKNKSTMNLLIHSPLLAQDSTMNVGQNYVKTAIFIAIPDKDTKGEGEGIHSIIRAYSAKTEELSSSVVGDLSVDQFDGICRSINCGDGNFWGNGIVDYDAFMRQKQSDEKAGPVLLDSHDSYVNASNYITVKTLIDVGVSVGDKIIPSDVNFSVSEMKIFADMNSTTPPPTSTTDTDSASKKDGVSPAYPDLPIFTQPSTKNKNKKTLASTHPGTKQFMLTIPPIDRMNVFTNMGTLGVSLFLDSLNLTMHELAGEFQVAFNLFIGLGCQCSFEFWKGFLGMVGCCGSDLFKSKSKGKSKGTKSKGMSGYKAYVSKFAEMVMVFKEVVLSQFVYIDEDLFHELNDTASAIDENDDCNDDEDVDGGNGFLSQSLKGLFRGLKSIESESQVDCGSDLFAGFVKGKYGYDCDSGGGGGGRSDIAPNKKKRGKSGFDHDVEGDGMSGCSSDSASDDDENEQQQQESEEEPEGEEDDDDDDDDDDPPTIVDWNDCNHAIDEEITADLIIASPNPNENENDEDFGGMIDEDDEWHTPPPPQPTTQQTQHNQIQQQMPIKQVLKSQLQITKIKYNLIYCEMMRSKALGVDEDVYMCCSRVLEESRKWSVENGGGGSGGVELKKEVVRFLEEMGDN